MTAERQGLSFSPAGEHSMKVLTEPQALGSRPTMNRASESGSHQDLCAPRAGQRGEGLSASGSWHGYDHRAVGS